MKINCESAILAKACMNVQRTVSSKSTIPAIEGILIKALGDSVSLTGYDLEVGTDTFIPAEVEENGSIILNARHLCDILRMVPDDMVSLESDERNICKIVSGEAKYSIIGTSADEYPDVPTVTSGFPIVVKQGLLKDMIDHLVFFAAILKSYGLALKICKLRRTGFSGFVHKKLHLLKFVRSLRNAVTDSL